MVYILSQGLFGNGVGEGGGESPLRTGCDGICILWLCHEFVCSPAHANDLTNISTVMMCKMFREIPKCV